MSFNSKSSNTTNKPNDKLQLARACKAKTFCGGNGNTVTSTTMALVNAAIVWRVPAISSTRCGALSLC